MVVVCCRTIPCLKIKSLDMNCPILCDGEKPKKYNKYEK